MANTPIPVEVDLSGLIGEIGEHTHEADGRVALAAQAVSKSLPSLEHFLNAWNRGGQDETVLSEERMEAQAHLLMSLHEVNKAASFITEALFHVHNVQAGRANVAEILASVRPDVPTVRA